jgi:hypothetical protein
MLTLAEIAFTILFALIILSLPQITEGHRTADERDKLATELRHAREELAKANQRIKILEEQPGGKLSNIPPPCTGDPVERLTVVAADEFLVKDEHLNAQTIGSRHSADLQWANQHKCRHRAVVSWRNSLPATEFATALTRLERYFRIVRATGVEIP